MQVAPWAIATVAVGLAAAVMIAPEAPAPAPMLTQLTLPDSVVPQTPPGQTVVLSRDGSQLAFVSRGPAGDGIYLRPMHALEARLIRGTESSNNPQFSPDGRDLLFTSSQSVKRVPINGGTPITLSDSANGTASWSDRNEVIFGFGPRLRRVSAEGGTVTVLSTLDSARGHLRYGYPHFLPGGKWALITLWKGGMSVSNAELGLVRLRDGRVTELGVRGSSPRLVSGRYVVFGRPDGTIFGAPFSRRRLRFTGPAVPLLDGVLVKGGGAVEITVSESGALVYKPGSVGSGRNLVRVDRSGAVSTVGADPQEFFYPRVSPNGRRVALEMRSSGGGTPDIWTYDLVSGTLMRTTTDGRSERPSWTRDGQRIAFMHSDSAGSNQPTIRAKAWDGTGSAEVLVEPSAITTVDAVFGPTGGYNVFKRVRVGNIWDIWIAPVDSPRALRPFLDSPAQETSPSLSPDGRLVAYVSDESGRREVYVRPLPGPGSRRQVSLSGGDEPAWSPKGRELFYRTADYFMSATIVERPELDVTRRDSLFPDPYSRGILRMNYDVFPSGNEFLFVQNRTASVSALHAIANWTEDVRKRISDSKRSTSR